MSRRRRKVELVKANLLSPTVRSLTFRYADGDALAFAAGQYVDLFVPTKTGLAYKRPYSIASRPEPDVRPGQLEIAVTRVEGGPASEALHAMPLGTTVEAEGPNGVFVRRDAPGDPLLFVAAGTGLAPLRAMIADARAKGDARPMTLLFGCRAEDHVLWRAEIDEWRNAMRVEITMSRAPASWTGRTGHVQKHLLDVGSSLGPRTHAYVCGLEVMVDDVVAMLERAGWDRARVHYETFD
jgi:CDP-4-dehydro-6-deoxyglucose reductase